MLLLLFGEATFYSLTLCVFAIDIIGLILDIGLKEPNVLSVVFDRYDYLVIPLQPISFGNCP